MDFIISEILSAHDAPGRDMHIYMSDHRDRIDWHTCAICTMNEPSGDGNSRQHVGPVLAAMEQHPAHPDPPCWKVMKTCLWISSTGNPQLSRTCRNLHVPLQSFQIKTFFAHVLHCFTFMPLATSLSCPQPQCDKRRLGCCNKKQVCQKACCCEIISWIFSVCFDSERILRIQIIQHRRVKL